MYIEISNVGIVALFFMFMYAAFIIGTEKLSMDKSKRVIYALGFGVVLLALLALLVAIG